MALSDRSNLIHAKALLQVIQQFGRFLYRNHALKKIYCVELDYLDRGGYGTTLHKLGNAIKILPLLKLKRY